LSKAVALVTSREALGTSGERLFGLGALLTDGLEGSPMGERRSHPEAVALFAERARAADPAFSLTAERSRTIAEICRRAEGIPLAIELVAARVASMSLDDIASRLDRGIAFLAANGYPPIQRHRSMQVALDWSQDLLDPHERALLRRLSVFTGAAPPMQPPRCAVVTSSRRMASPTTYQQSKAQLPPTPPRLATSEPTSLWFGSHRTAEKTATQEAPTWVPNSNKKATCGSPPPPS
jgi:hypothetical protein